MAAVILLVSTIVIGMPGMKLFAEEGILSGTEFELSGDIAINSKYAWRGFILDDDPVMQSGFYVSGHGITLGIWGSMDMGAEDSLNSDEVDYLFDYTREFGILSVSGGHTYYDFPAGDAASREFYVGLGFDIPASPALTWYHDYGEEDSGGGEGDYVALEFGYSFPITNSSITFDVGGHVGYNSRLFISGEGQDTAISLGINIPLTEKASISSNINYSIPFGDLKEPDDGNQGDEFYGGITLVFTP